MPSDLKVLIVGQTPPPFHGQSIMIQMLVDGPLKNVQTHLVRMNFSEELGEVGRFRWKKVLHLLHVIVQVIWSRFRHGILVLYYPPCGPNKVPLIRDIILLLSTRWLFAKTVFHFQASGVSELIPKLPWAFRTLAMLALGKPDVAIELSDLTVPDGSFLGAQNVVRVPNAAEDHAARFLDPRKPRKPELTRKLLYVGTVCEEKGIEVLIAAFKNLVDEGLKIQLDIVGGAQPSEYQSRIENLVRSNGLSSTVTLHGQLTGEAKWRIFAGSDIFCFPTFYQSEGFPCVLVEAMSFGMPIVSTRWRGIPSIVEHGVNGLLSPTRDVDSLRLAIKQIVEDTQLSDAMGRNSRIRFESEFHRDRHLQLMSDVFALLETRRAR
jgi:glycosyltransferase involved in cell wall biosynthesis